MSNNTISSALDITDSLIFKKFTIKTIEDVFIKIGKLENGCFNVTKEYFSDGSYKINFHYPTDMNAEKACKFFETLLETLGTMTLKDFIFILEKE